MFRLDALRDRDLRRVFTAQLLSQLGDKLMLVGVMWFLAERFAQAWAPLFAALTALPHLVLAGASPRLIARLGGPLAAVIATDFARAGLFVAFGTALAFASRLDATADGAWLVSLIALGLIGNAFGAIFNPAVMSLPERIVAARARGGFADPSEVGRATAALESCFSLSAVLAPALATLLYAGIGLPGLLLINGLSYGVAAWIETGISRVRAPAPTSTLGVAPVIADPGAAAAAIGPREVLRRDPETARLLAGFLVFNLATGPVLVFLPLYASQIYRGSIGDLAWLESALGVGTLLGTTLLTVTRLPGDARTQVPWALGGIAVAYLAFVSSPGVLAGAASIGALGLLLAAANVAVLGSLKERPDPAEIPAVMSCVNLISVASLPVSMTLAGLLLRVAPLRGVAAGFALASAAVAAVLAIVSRSAVPRPQAREASS